jgi:hypothetical protein
MSSRSDTSSPMQCRQPPQAQVRLAGSITSSIRAKCFGSAPRLVARCLAGRFAARSSASSSAWIAAIAVSRSSSASSNCSALSSFAGKRLPGNRSLFSDRRPKAACLKAATSFSSRSMRSSLRRSRASAAINIAFSAAISSSKSAVFGMLHVYQNVAANARGNHHLSHPAAVIPPLQALAPQWREHVANPTQKTAPQTARGSTSSARLSRRAM